MHPDVEAVLRELDDHRAKFEAFCRSLSQEELDRAVPKSTWIVRDFIAHLATIDGPVSEMFRATRSGKPADARGEGTGKWDVDSWNDHQVETRRTRSVDEVLAEAAEARAALREEMVGFTAEDLAKSLNFGGDSKRGATQIPFINYLRGWCKHDPMHVVDMLRALPERRTPEIERWIDDPIIAGYQAQMNRE